jgi:hypothetical protein
MESQDAAVQELAGSSRKSGFSRNKHRCIVCVLTWVWALDGGTLEIQDAAVQELPGSSRKSVSRNIYGVCGVCVC